MPPKNKLPLCTASVKGEVTLTVAPCGTQITLRDQRFWCRNNANHLMKYKTGFCENGNCEGSAKKTHDGRPMVTCKWWLVCPCDCHTMFDMMYKQSGMPRVLVDNSGYEPPPGLWIPSADDRARIDALSSSGVTDAAVVIESPVVEAVPVTIRREFGPTPTGIAARGELESWVKDECDAWLIDGEDDYCTPPYLSEAIAKSVGLGKAPSVGAISSVFDRWVTLGFAVIERKPTRFVSYTPEALTLGLEGLKARRKRTRKFEDSAAKRGTLR